MAEDVKVIKEGGKDPKKSKTVLFGLVVGLIPVISKYLPAVGSFLDENQGAVYAVIAVVTLLLRKVTGDRLDLDKIFKV